MKETLTLCLSLALCISLASTKYHEIPQKSWILALIETKDAKPQLYNEGLPIFGSQVTSVKWGECSSQHIYEVATGTSSPNPPIVGEDVQLNLDIVLNAEASIKGIFVDVKLTPQGSTTPIDLYSEDSQATNPGHYDPGDEFNDSVSWLIPSFAPLGHYAVSILVHGDDQKADNYACLTADFDIVE